eukprot:657796-Amphidinium_carterae.1
MPNVPFEFSFLVLCAALSFRQRHSIVCAAETTVQEAVAHHIVKQEYFEGSSACKNSLLRGAQEQPTAPYNDITSNLDVICILCPMMFAGTLFSSSEVCEPSSAVSKAKSARSQPEDRSGANSLILMIESQTISRNRSRDVGKKE